MRQEAHQTEDLFSRDVRHRKRSCLSECFLVALKRAHLMDEVDSGKIKSPESGGARDFVIFSLQQFFRKTLVVADHRNFIRSFDSAFVQAYCHSRTQPC